MPAVHLPQLPPGLAACISYTSKTSYLLKILRGVQVPHDRLLPGLVKIMPRSTTTFTDTKIGEHACFFYIYILATHFAFCSLLHTVTCSTELLQGIPWWLSIEPCWLFTWAKLSYLQIKYCLGSSIISLTDEVTALLTFAPPAGMIAIKLARLVRNVQKRVFKKEKDKNVTSSLGGTRWWDLLDNNSHTHKSIHSCSLVVQMLSQQKLAGLLTHRDTLK